MAGIRRHQAKAAMRAGKQGHVGRSGGAAIEFCGSRCHHLIMLGRRCWVALPERNDGQHQPRQIFLLQRG